MPNYMHINEIFMAIYVTYSFMASNFSHILSIKARLLIMTYLSQNVLKEKTHKST